jgi:hypothetical protein
MPVVVEQVGCAPKEARSGLGLIADRVERRDPPRHAEADHAVLQVEVVRDGEHRQVAAEEPGEVLLRPEGEPSGDRMQAVRPDHQIVRSRIGVLESHRHPVPIVMQGRYGVAEDVLNLVPGRLEQDSGEVAAHDFDVAFRHSFAEHGHRHLDRAASGTDQSHDFGCGPGLLHLVSDAHPVHDVEHGTEEVDGVTAASLAQLGRSLDHSGSKAEPMQPVGQRRASNAGARNQHARLDRHEALLRDETPPLFHRLMLVRTFQASQGQGQDGGG